MSPFTWLDHECISSLAIATSPYWSFSWGDIALLVLPSLAAYKPASSTTPFGCSLLCPNICFRCTPTYQAYQYVLIQTLCLNLTFAWSSSSATKSLLQRSDHKRTVYKKIVSRHSQVHQAPLFQLESWVGNTMSALQFNHLPLKPPSVSHQLCGLLQGWSPCRDNPFLLFYYWFVRISTDIAATMPLCTIFFQNPGGYYNKHGGLHLYPILFSPKHMGVPLSSNISIFHSSTFPTDRQISCWGFQNLFLRDFLLGFLSQLPHLSTHWMGGVDVIFHGRLISC